MRRDEDIEGLVRGIEGIHAALHEEGTDLSDRVAGAERAAELYHAFRERFFSKEFSMRAARKTPEGIAFEEFDWKALDV